MRGTKRARLTPEINEQTRRLFELPDVPDSIRYAYDKDIRLELPKDHLTDEQIRVIAAGCVIYKAPFCFGDLLLWLKDHPEAPHTGKEIFNLWRRTGIAKQTLHNYQSVAKSFPTKERIFDLPFGYYDAVSAMKPESRDSLLRQAVHEGWSLNQLIDHKLELEGRSATFGAVEIAELQGLLAGCDRALGRESDATPERVSREALLKAFEPLFDKLDRLGVSRRRSRKRRRPPS